MAKVAAAAVAAGAAALVYACRRQQVGRADAAFVQQVHHPSALRNRIPILKQLLSLSPDSVRGLALEIGSGSGAHLEVYAPAFPGLTFHPTEFVPKVAASPEEQWSKHGKIGHRQGCDELANIDAHGCEVFPNVVPAAELDLAAPWEEWPSGVREAEGTFVIVICSNTLHITPWQCSVGLLRGAARALAPEGQLVLYGPFKVNNEFVGADGGAGNAKFDERLRETNPQWGIRDVADISEVAAPCGLKFRSKVDMPANNLLLCFVKK